ncbi:neuroblast differentiation-associated protein AHNAK-like, partial [Arapaima gigas]
MRANSARSRVGLPASLPAVQLKRSPKTGEDEETVSEKELHPERGQQAHQRLQASGRFSEDVLAISSACQVNFWVAPVLLAMCLSPFIDPSIVLKLKTRRNQESFRMAEEEETREVLFPEWMGPDQYGLKIEQTGEGEIFVKEVKEESIAARTGRVHEGDQIVGATIYFENMSSEETAELLKTLNRHKVGLKLQNRGAEKSPHLSPVGTLTWEGRTRFGGSSPDIILSGDDEDYKRIYTKKIKPRLKSEDLAEGVNVRTERHSSTSSDGSTITTVTRRVTTYTVDVPTEKIDLSSPEFKIKVPRHETPGDGASYSTHVTFGASGASEKHWTVGGLKTTEGTRAGEGDDQELRIRVPGFAMSGDKTQGDFSVSGVTYQKDLKRDLQVPAADLNVSLPGGTKDAQFISVSGSSIKTVGEMGKRDMKIAEGSLDIEGTTYIGHGSGDIKISDVTLSGPQVLSGDASMTTPEFQISGKGPGIEIKEGAETKMPDITISGTSGHKGGIGTTAPSINIKTTTISTQKEGTKGGVKVSSFEIRGQSTEGKDITLSAPSTGMSGATLKGEIKTKTVDFSVPEMDIKGSKSEIKVPSFAPKGATVEGRSVEIKGATGEITEGSKSIVMFPHIDTKSVQIEAGAECPNADIKVPEGGIQIKMPPSVSKGPMVEAPDVTFSTSDMTVKGLKGYIKDPKLHIEAPDVKVKGPNIKMSTPTGASHTITRDVHISLPHTSEISLSKTDIKGPKVDITAPVADLKGHDGKVTAPTMGMPSISGPNISMSNIDINLKGPKLKGDVDMSVPKVEGDIKGPKVDIEGPDVDIHGPEGGFKMPKIKMPKFGIKGPKMEGPDVDVNLPKADIDIKGPKVDIEGPEVDVEGPDGKIKGPKFKMPSISGPKISTRDVDINLKGPKLKGDVDVSVPKVEGDIKGPKVDIEGPDVDVHGPEGGFKMPKIKMPKFGIKGPKMEGPDVDVNLPKADIDIKGPKVDIEGPEVDVEGPDGKIKGPKFKMPSISAPKISTPDVDINLKGPKLKGDMDVSVPKVEGDIKGPKVDIEGPDVEVHGPEGGFKMPKIKMPKFGIKGPKMEGPDVDVNLPKADIDIKGPKVDIEGPELDIEGPDGKIKGPKFKMPSISAPKISMPDMDFNLKGPKLKGDVDVSVPKVEGDIKGPKVDIEGPDFDVEGPEGKMKGPKFKIPSISGPKISMPDLDFNLKGPKLKGDVDVSVPKVEGDIKGPKVDIEGPDVDIHGPEGGFKMPKMKMPKFGIKGPKMEGPDVDVNLPKADIDIKGPKVDIEGPELDVEGPDGKIKGPKFKMPSIS